MKLRKFKRKVRHAVQVILVSVGLSGVIGGGIAHDAYLSAERATEAKRIRKAERAKTLAEIRELRQKIVELTEAANAKMRKGEPLEIAHAEMFGEDSVKVLDQIRSKIYELEIKLHSLEEEE